MIRSKFALLLAGSAALVMGQGVEVHKPAAMGVSPSLASLTGQVAPQSFAGEFDRKTPSRAELAARASRIAPSLALSNSPTFFQTTLGSLPVEVVGNFAGLGRGFNANWGDQFIIPPDTTMAVGPNHIVQWVNVRLTILNKAGVPQIGGALGYINGNAIWTGLPITSVCRNTNQGDPILQYDRMADRWVLSQFAFNVSGSGILAAPFAQCIAVSTSGDPTGTYALYEYIFDALPDYGKLGLWPDAYYISYNDFSVNPTTGATSFAGAKVCAYDRAAMIAGNSATQICTARTTSFFSFLPSDMDGNTPPPAGAPNYVLSQDWFFLFSPPYSLRLQKFKVDFATPANSTFSDGLGGGFGSFIRIPMGDLLGACGDNGGACVAQPGTPRVLDTLSMRPMYRLAYRNRGPGLESLLLTHTIDPITGASATTAGLHWTEIRNPGANPPQVFQNGAINTPDGLNRWMGSAAMDKAGNIAMGYSVSSSTVSPGIRVAGRFRSDIRSRLRGEFTVVNGGGSQTSTAQRWGDYSTMQIDPSDDCTFWYTQQYMTGTFTRDWATRIFGFRFPGCLTTATTTPVQ